MYAAFGVSSPFWPAFFETKALTAQQIGFILAAGMLVRLVMGPLIGRLADVSQRLRAVLAACAALAATVTAAFSISDTFSTLLTVALLQAATLAPMASLADALAVNVARPRLAGKTFEYGWLRGSASAAFVAGTLVVGQLISRINFMPMIWMNVALLAATAGATSLLPRAHQSRSHVIRSRGFAGVDGLIRMPRFRIVILVSALVFGSHALHDAFSVIRWSGAGIDTAMISLLWSEAVAGDCLSFSWSSIGQEIRGPWRCYARRFSWSCTVVGCGRSHVGLVAVDFATLAWTHFCAASSCVHAGHGGSCPNSSIGDGANSLRFRHRDRDRRAYLVIRQLVRLVWGSLIFCNGSSLRSRAPICLVRSLREYRELRGARYRHVDMSRMAQKRVSTAFTETTRRPGTGHAPRLGCSWHPCLRGLHRVVRVGNREPTFETRQAVWSIHRPRALA